jgi:DUF4097 and DUF4098 domain-containing protein YvlB
MKNARDFLRMSTPLMVVFSLLSLLAAQERKTLMYTVGRKAIISVTNNYGPITVKPSRNRQVVVTTVLHSEAVSFVHEQHGNRIELRSISSRQGAGIVDYTVLVPADAVVSLRSSEGNLRAEGLCGDIVLEALTGSAEATDIRDAHIQVKTLSGPISLTGIRNSHLDAHSVSGNVSVHDVTGSSAEVNSGSGRITYEGDPGSAGEYLLTSQSGDLEVSIPASALVEIRSHSINGETDQDFTKSDGAPPMGQKNLLLKPGLTGACRFVLLSFRGRIHLKRP